ncbi:hypothetical protein [Fonticella tunisiensis]|nr:hypothetical protein [Fonticella tunisiensis]
MRKHNKTFHIRFTESEYGKLCSLSERAGCKRGYDYKSQTAYLKRA